MYAINQAPPSLTDKLNPTPATPWKPQVGQHAFAPNGETIEILALGGRGRTAWAQDQEGRTWAQSELKPAIRDSFIQQTVRLGADGRRRTALVVGPDLPVGGFDVVTQNGDLLARIFVCQFPGGGGNVDVVLNAESPDYPQQLGTALRFYEGNREWGPSGPGTFAVDIRVQAITPEVQKK